jgi:hypothetical protein
VQTNFDWGKGQLEDLSIRTWQEDSLGELGYLLSKQKREGVFHPIKQTRSAGHGPGKSAEICWDILWALGTFPEARANVTANTETQLRTKTGSELQKWHSLSLISPMFKCSRLSMFSTIPTREATWRADLIPWSQTNPEAVAGLHNFGKRTLIVFDEASNIATEVFDSIDGATIDSETEVIVLMRGNPTRNTGYFYNANFGAMAKRWRGEVIDCRKVEGINQKLIDEWIEDYGVDSDYVRVRVRGLPPKHSSSEFMSRDAVEAAMSDEREPICFPDEALVMGIDCARGGANETVFAYRQGLDMRTRPWDRFAFTPKPMEIASKAHDRAQQYGVDLVFVDSGDIGLAVANRLVELGTNAVDIGFGWKATDPDRFANRAAEMASRFRDWLPRGALPTWSDEMAQRERVINQICDRGFGHPDGRLRLESKEHMAQRGAPSPDHFDAPGLTFAEEMLPPAGGRVRVKEADYAKWD